MPKRFLAITGISFLIALVVVSAGVGVIALLLRNQPATPAAKRIVQVSPKNSAAIESVVLPSVSPEVK